MKTKIVITLALLIFCSSLPAEVPLGQELKRGDVTIIVAKNSLRGWWAYIPDAILVQAWSDNTATVGYAIAVNCRTPDGKDLRLVDFTGVQPGSTFGMVRIPVDLATVASIVSVDVSEIQPPAKVQNFQK